MIIVQLKGGLGNQLFQYAAGLSLATYHNVDVAVDVSELKTPDELIGTLRNYELQNLIAPPRIANAEEIKRVTGQNIFNKYFQKFLPSYKRQIYNEKQFPFDENFFESGKNIYLKGYRQSEKYFIHIKDKIRKEFSLKPGLVNNVSTLVIELQKQESVSIHIRRGDYTNAMVQQYHGIVAKEYYQDAINKISSTVSNPTFFIFSDSIDWVKENLEFKSNVQIVSGSLSQTHYEDFYLMSQCRHNIIANSSFSWWPAWLNANPNKVVVAPKKWFGNAPNDTRDLIPADWMQL